MAVDILTANVLDGFSDGQTARHLTQQINGLRPDIAIFPEAFTEGAEEWLPLVEREFNEAGYHVVHGPYDDTDGRTDRHGILAIARTEIVEPDSIGLVRFAGRTGVRMVAYDDARQQELDVFGFHADDRLPVTRAEQTIDFIEMMDPKMPTALAGDLNNMHRRDGRARLLRAIRPLAELLPVADPASLLPGAERKPKDLQALLGRIGSLTTRLSGMAVGDRDADPHHRPTMPDSRWLPPVVQLDHVMVSRHLGVVAHELVALRDAGGRRLTDHLAVRAQVTVAV